MTKLSKNPNKKERIKNLCIIDMIFFTSTPLISAKTSFKLCGLTANNTKSELDTRPIFVRTNGHIEAHFTTCFTALVLIRLLEKRLEEKYPVEQILESLRRYNTVQFDKNIYTFTRKYKHFWEFKAVIESQGFHLDYF